MQVYYNNTITKENPINNSSVARKQVNTCHDNFGSLLNEKIEEAGKLKFTKHANMRLCTRAIDLSSEQMKRVESGIDMARAKGIMESLVIVANIALVVNTKSNVVITAMDKEKKESVFTNIDGAVIV